jgi:hypothetical protein
MLAGRLSAPGFHLNVLGGVSVYLFPVVLIAWA